MRGSLIWCFDVKLPEVEWVALYKASFEQRGEWAHLGMEMGLGSNALLAGVSEVRVLTSKPSLGLALYAQIGELRWLHRAHVPLHLCGAIRHVGVGSCIPRPQTHPRLHRRATRPTNDGTYTRRHPTPRERPQPGLAKH